MKKLLITGLLFLMVFAVTSCAGRNDGGNGTTDESTVSVETTSPDETEPDTEITDTDISVITTEPEETTTEYKNPPSYKTMVVETSDVPSYEEMLANTPDENPPCPYGYAANTQKYHFAHNFWSNNVVSDFIKEASPLSEEEMSAAIKQQREIMDREGCVYGPSLLWQLREFGITREQFEEFYYLYLYDYDYDLDFFWNATIEEWHAVCRLPKEVVHPYRKAKDGDQKFKENLRTLAETDERFVSVREKYEALGYKGYVMGSWDFSYAEFVKDTGISKEELEALWEETVAYMEKGGMMYSYDFDDLYENLDYYLSLQGTEGYEYPVLVDELIRKDIIKVTVNANV